MNIYLPYHGSLVIASFMYLKKHSHQHASFGDCLKIKCMKLGEMELPWRGG